MARDMASRQLVLEEISAAARKRLEAAWRFWQLLFIYSCSFHFHLFISFLPFKNWLN